MDDLRSTVLELLKLDAECDNGRLCDTSFTNYDGEDEACGDTPSQSPELAAIIAKLREFTK